MGNSGLSLIVTDARRLYERCGYRHIAERKCVKENWRNDGENRVLQVKIY